VTVLNQNEVAIVFGLEVAVQRYGSHIACSGGDDEKRQVVKAFVQNGKFVEFTDLEDRELIMIAGAYLGVASGSSLRLRSSL
jgi:hypothetical protein